MPYQIRIKRERRKRRGAGTNEADLGAHVTREIDLDHQKDQIEIENAQGQDLLLVVGDAAVNLENVNETVVGIGKWLESREILRIILPTPRLKAAGDLVPRVRSE